MTFTVQLEFRLERLTVPSCCDALTDCAKEPLMDCRTDGVSLSKRYLQRSLGWLVFSNCQLVFLVDADTS